MTKGLFHGTPWVFLPYRSFCRRSQAYDKRLTAPASLLRVSAVHIANNSPRSEPERAGVGQAGQMAHFESQRLRAGIEQNQQVLG